MKEAYRASQFTFVYAFCEFSIMMVKEYNLSHIDLTKADIVLRGYAGWNSRRALQNLDKIFPKVLSICGNSLC